MGKILLVFAAISTYFPLSWFDILPSKIENSKSPAIVAQEPQFLDVTKTMLQKEAPDLSPGVINKVLVSLRCAAERNVEHTNLLTIIDYSLPSSDKRLWIFDLRQKKLLFKTYVSHGIKSGTLMTNFFSNKYNSKASSIGVYRTDQAYYGREGLSLRLNGLEATFNDNASNRSIVMHGGWYMDEQFIKKYGRPGRSWGCPAVPLSMYRQIINAIKDNSFLVVYYPSENWFAKSRFLNCANLPEHYLSKKEDTQLATGENEKRDDVVFAFVGKKSPENAVVAMTAENYERIFHNKAPLGRMLRRQINHVEYIALSADELLKVGTNPDALNAIYFVIPEIIMVRGYYETQMKIVPMGKIKEVRLNGNGTGATKNYTVYFEASSPISLRSTDQFIRWVGL